MNLEQIENKLKNYSTIKDIVDTYYELIRNINDEIISYCFDSLIMMEENNKWFLLSLYTNYNKNNIQYQLKVELKYELTIEITKYKNLIISDNITNYFKSIKNSSLYLHFLKENIFNDLNK